MGATIVIARRKKKMDDEGEKKNAQTTGVKEIQRFLFSAS